MTNPFDDVKARVEKPNPIAVIMTQVRTDLAKKTDNYIVVAFQKVGINPNVVLEQDREITKLKNALQAVLEIHKDNGAGVCGACAEFYNGDWTENFFPCPTVLAIAKELGVE